MKGVATDPSLRDPASIGHRFTNKMLRELKIGGVGFLLPAEEDKFQRILERQKESLCILTKVDRVHQPNYRRTNGDLRDIECAMEPQTNSGAKG